MPNITIRNLELRFKRELRRRAAERGCSLEEEARDILRAALSRRPSGHRAGAGRAEGIVLDTPPLGHSKGIVLDAPPLDLSEGIVLDAPLAGRSAGVGMDAPPPESPFAPR